MNYKDFCKELVKLKKDSLGLSDIDFYKKLYKLVGMLSVVKMLTYTDAYYLKSP